MIDYLINLIKVLQTSEYQSIMTSEQNLAVFT